MDKKTIQETLKKLKETAPKKKFNQSIDLIIVLKDLDLKKPDNQVDLFTVLNYERGKPVKVCGLAGPEMAESSKSDLDFTITTDEFVQYQKDKKATKKIGSKYDFFVAQANIMPQVAQTFGRVLGPKQKMPNPKGGCVVPPNANLSVLKERLQKTVRILVKTAPVYQVRVGTEASKEEEVVDNIMTIYNNLIHNVPGEENNIKELGLKLTMSPVIKITAAVEEKKGKK